MSQPTAWRMGMAKFGASALKSGTSRLRMRLRSQAPRLPRSTNLRLLQPICLTDGRLARSLHSQVHPRSRLKAERSSES